MDDADRRVTVHVDRSRLRRAGRRRRDRAARLRRDRAGAANADLRFDPKPVVAPPADAGQRLALGDAVETPQPPPVDVARALDAFFASSTGAYGVLIATPERVLCERYSAFGGPDRATPSWSMTKAITCTVIGRLIQEGWLGSVYDPAPAPLWRDPRAIHHLITLDHLLRMRSGLGFPVRARRREGDARL